VQAEADLGAFELPKLGRAGAGKLTAVRRWQTDRANRVHARITYARNHSDSVRSCTAKSTRRSWTRSQLAMCLSSFNGIGRLCALYFSTVAWTLRAGLPAWPPRFGHRAFDRFHVVFVGVLGCWQAPVGAVMLELPDVTLGTVSGRRRERRWT
jgi:hypothetical protein